MVRNIIVGKAVIYKALHKGDVNLRVRIAEPLRNEDCSTANLRTRQTGWYSVTKPLFAQWTKNVKCNIRICFHLWQSVNENKCITAVRVPTKVIDENLWNPRRLRVSSVNKIAQAVVLPSIKGNLRLLWELHAKVTGFNRSLNTK